MKFPPLVILTVWSLVLAGCNDKSNAHKATVPVPVLTAAAVAKNMPVMITPAPVGHVTPVSSVTIRPQIGGIINTVNFREGQAVRKGDLLFTIDARPAQAALTLAKGNLQRDEALLKNSRIQFDRDGKLFDQKLISQDALDTSKAALDTLAGTVAADHAAVTNAELDLQYTEIRAPIDGVTGGLQFHAGNVVKSPDDVLLTINQIHPIYVAFAVAERYLPEIQKQLRGRTLTAAASFENLAGDPPVGELSFVDNSVDTTTGTILLKATFPNEGSQLWPGQFVQLALQLDELTNAVAVPAQAVQTGQSGPFVFVVKPDQTVEQRMVTTAVTVKGETALTTGVKAGEIIVIDGQLRLAPGVAINDKSRSGTNAP